jgi:hypothetical protein
MRVFIYGIDDQCKSHIYFSLPMQTSFHQIQISVWFFLDNFSMGTCFIEKISTSIYMFVFVKYHIWYWYIIHTWYLPDRLK